MGAKSPRIVVDWEQARLHMVEEQIVRRGVYDRDVLNAMRSVPRHRFVEKRHEKRAYADSPLPIGHGQTISQPYIVAMMCESLRLSENSTVLEIGTGCGYQAAILSMLARLVATVEIIEPLYRRAASRMAELEYSNVTCILGDGAEGAPAFGSFDAIVVAAAAPALPGRLLSQLVNGGRALYPEDRGAGYQELVLCRREGNKIVRSDLIPVRFVPMTGSIRR